MPDEARKLLEKIDKLERVVHDPELVAHLRRLLAANERLEAHFEIEKELHREAIGRAEDYGVRTIELEARVQRLTEAMNKALDLDSRSHTREGWKRDIVQAMQVLRDALDA